MKKNEKRTVIIPAPGYESMAREFVDLSPQHFELGRYHRGLFGSESDDRAGREILQRVDTIIEGRKFAVLGGFHNNAEIWPTYSLCCGLVSYGASKLTMINPFIAYSTMERAVNPGEIVTFKNLARLISSIPQATEGNRLILCDLHKEGQENYFEGRLRVRHTYLEEVVLQAIRDAGGENYKLVAPDLGRAKWARAHAEKLAVEVGVVDKDRTGAEVTAQALYGNVNGAAVVLYDDMGRSCRSLTEAARICKHHGAVRIAVVISHGELNGSALDNMRASGLFERVIATGTHPKALALAEEGKHRDFFEVRSVVPLLVDRLTAPSRKNR